MSDRQAKHHPVADDEPENDAQRAMLRQNYHGSESVVVGNRRRSAPHAERRRARAIAPRIAAHIAHSDHHIAYRQCVLRRFTSRLSHNRKVDGSGGSISP